MTARYDFQDMGPIKPQDIMPGVGGGFTQKIPFNRQIADRINKLYMSSPLVSTAVNQMVSFLTRTSVVVDGEGAQTISEAQIKYELQPAINKMMLEWLLYGYTNVCKGKSRVNPGRSTINVVPFGFVQQTLEWDDNWQVSYEAQTTFQHGTTKSDITVLCMYPPDERGMLTSPLAHCVAHLAYAEHLWTTYMTGSERGVNPTFIFTQTPKTSGTLPGIDRTPLSTSLVTSGGLGQMPIGNIIKDAEMDAFEHTRKVLDDSRTQRSEALARQRAERELIKKQSAHDSVYDTDTALPASVRGNLSTDPLGNLYLAPSGHAVAPGPEFKTPADFPRILELVSEELYRALGLPIIMLHARADTSSSVDFAVRSLNASVTEMHKRASALISEVINKYVGPDIKKERINAALAEEVVAIAESSSSKTPPLDLKEVNISVNFVTNPVTTFELARTVYASGLINDDFYQDWALKILNLPPEAKRPEMVEWLKEQREFESGAKRQRID
jgi:hypothetical protein